MREYTVHISSARSTVTPKQFLADVENRLPYYKAVAKETLCGLIDELSIDELKAVFRKGRRQYGGTFDPDSIPAVMELCKEAADSVLYVAIHDCQNEH